MPAATSTHLHCGGSCLHWNIKGDEQMGRSGRLKGQNSPQNLCLGGRRKTQGQVASRESKGGKGPGPPTTLKKGMGFGCGAATNHFFHDSAKTAPIVPYHSTMFFFAPHPPPHTEAAFWGHTWLGLFPPPSGISAFPSLFPVRLSLPTVRLSRPRLYAGACPEWSAQL